MKAKRRTEITVETHETTIIRFQQSQTIVFCESCQTATPHLSIGQVASILWLPEQAIKRLIDNKQIHYLETGTDELLICSNSFLTKNKKQ